MHFDPSKKLDDIQAIKIVREITRFGEIIYSSHVKQRMIERGYTNRDIVYILKHGRIIKKNSTKIAKIGDIHFSAKTWMELLERNRSHSLAADGLLQGFNCGQGCTKMRILNGLCFETCKRLLAVRGGSE